MILNKKMLDGLKNAQYVEHLFKMFKGEVNLFTLFDRDIEYELNKGRMDIVCGHPSYKTKNSIICHEIGHIVDSSKSRVIKNNFGFKFIGRPSGGWKNKVKFATVSTEIRTYAIETMLLGEEQYYGPEDYNLFTIAKKLGIEKKFAKSYFHELAFGLKDSMPNKFKSDEDVMIWGANLYNRTQEKYKDLSGIEAEFVKKINCINEHYCLIFFSS